MGETMNHRPSFRPAAVWLPLVLLLFSTLHASFSLAKDIEPVGDKAAVDDKGRAIYQANVNGIKIGYKLIGSGEPLLLLTGLGCTMERWTPEFLEEAAKKHQLIVMDNRGMGYSTDDGRKFSYPLFAQDAVGLLDALGVQKTDVLGFSQSSVTTQCLLLYHAERIKKAIIHATSIDGKAVAAAFKSVPLPDNPTIKKQLEAAKGWKSPLDKMALITNPVMFLVGTSDTVVGVKSSKVLADRIPGAWLIQFKNKTHHLQFEAPLAFTQVVLTFLTVNTP